MHHQNIQNSLPSLTILLNSHLGKHSSGEHSTYNPLIGPQNATLGRLLDLISGDDRSKKSGLCNHPREGHGEHSFLFAEATFVQEDSNFRGFFGFFDRNYRLLLFTDYILNFLCRN